MNIWFEKKPLFSKDKNVLSKTYNVKYGKYDYNNDSRSIDNSFLNIFENLILKEHFSNIIICGANSGYEVDLIHKLKPGVKIAAVDISDTALKKLHTHFPLVDCFHEDLENLSIIKQKLYDTYMCLRAIHSSNVNIENALKEAMRITKNKIILSISNGYIIDGKLVRGIYEYDTEIINPQTPYVISDKIQKMLNQTGWQTTSYESEAEIFIVAIPKITE